MRIMSMKLLPAEAAKETVEAQEMQRPEYPWGMCIYLNEEALKMLGFNKGMDDFEVGEEVIIQGVAKVTGISMRSYEGSEEQRSVDLQITDLGIEFSVDDEEEEAKPKTVGERLYAK